MNDSEVAVLFNSDLRTPFSLTGRQFLSAALHRIRFGTCCFVRRSYFFWETNDWSKDWAKRWARHWSATSHQFHWKFHFTSKRKYSLRPDSEIYKALKPFDSRTESVSQSVVACFPQASLSWPQPLQQTRNVFVLASPTHSSSAGKLTQETWLVATQNTRCAQPTKKLLAAAAARIDGRTAAATAATSWRHYARQMRPTKFPRSCPIRTALTFQCRVIADIKGIICCKLKIIND